MGESLPVRSTYDPFSVQPLCAHDRTVRLSELKYNPLSVRTLTLVHNRLQFYSLQAAGKLLVAR